MFDIFARLKNEVFIVEPNYAQELLKGLESIKAGTTHTAIANEDVTLQVIENVAVIALDGVMYKKNIGGMCETVASYDKISLLIDEAERNAEVDTILFRIDTAGGSVAGADAVREKIKASSKKTILYAENLLASAGLWVFSVVDEIYSNETTQIGSIGVVVMWEEKAEGKTVRHIVSSNAPNKVCNINDKKCQSRIQAKLNRYETMFYNRLVEAFNKDRETIQADFNDGDTIFASEAFEKGYIKELLSFEEVLNLAVMPPEGKITNTMQGDTMSKVTESATVAKTDGGEAMKAKDELIATQKETITDLRGALEAKTEQIQAMQEQISALKAEKDTLLEKMQVTLKEAEALGVSDAEAILKAVNAKDDEEASKALMEAKKDEAVALQEGGEDEEAKVEEAILAWAEKNKIRS